jgi:hypothetical protein
MVGVVLHKLNNKHVIYGNWNAVTEYITEEIIDKSKELLYKHKENKLENNTTTYLTPLSPFPSYKLKNYIEENKLNIKISRKLNTLDSIIINYDFIYSSYLKNIEEYYIIPADKILNNKLLLKYIPKDKKYYSIHERDDKNVTHYFISPDVCKDFISKDNNFYFIKEYPLTKCVIIDGSWGNKKVKDNVGFFLNLLEIIEKHNLKIIYDHHINNATNQGLTLDEDVFENIINMVSSQDESNTELAKEIMANLEFESSKPRFIYLFNYFYKLKTNRSNNKNYNYLNKQLKNNIHTHGSKHNPIVFDEMLPILIKKYPEYSQEFMNCFRIHINIMLGKNIIKEIQTY